MFVRDSRTDTRTHEHSINILCLRPLRWRRHNNYNSLTSKRNRVHDLCFIVHLTCMSELLPTRRQKTHVNGSHLNEFWHAPLATILVRCFLPKNNPLLCALANRADSFHYFFFHFSFNKPFLMLSRTVEFYQKQKWPLSK